MHQHSFASHSPEEMRRLSDLGHISEGVLLGSVAILALLNALGIAAWSSIAWPLLLLLSGVVLLFLIYLRHPFSDWLAIWRDRQQRQHTQMAVASALAGAAELLRGRAAIVLLALVWPAVLIFIGTLFITHTQHGTGEAVARAVTKHRVLGATIVLAGLLRAAEIFLGPSWFALAWPLALLAAAAQFVLYREPEGAFERVKEHGTHG